MDTGSGMGETSFSSKRQKLEHTGFGALTKYDVFLNHRGPDLKKTFVSHLSKALHHASCEPFLDAKALVKGRHAFNSINEALSGVLVHVAIFSPRYAESKYCLNELCDMLASQKPIIPVFYDVEPENLLLTYVGPFAEAFHGHLRKGRDEDVVRWKAALLQVAGITGFNLVDCNGDTVKLEEKVVAAVLDAIPTPLSFTGFGALTKYDVFLNHRGPDLKKTFVSHLSKALHHASCEPFVDAKALVKGRHAFNSIDEALSGVLVHVAIFSPRYAESKYCLNELCDMLASQKPIIPVFYDVEPENLRWTDVGPFAKAFHGHLRKGRDADVVRWKAALLQVAGITGFKLVDCSGDTVKLEEKVVAAVLDALPTPLSFTGFGALTKYDVFLNHRGPDLKKTFVSHLSKALHHASCEPFVDAKALVKGQHAFNSINEALSGVLVHVAIFSPRYAESKYCLNELCDMLASQKPIIPVFYDVEPENLRWTDVGPFAEAFHGHLRKGRDEDVVRWKAALLQVAGITGFKLVDCSGDTVKLEEKVVAAVLDALPTPLSFTGFGALTKYDVFLNHRGPDLKKTFVSHLSKALHHASCEPFVDAKALMKGQHAFNSTNEALSGVLVHVAIFSPRYAESKYCLNELCDMLASQKPIIPVFYDVEPENLRRTDVGPFAEAFHGHLRRGRDAYVVRWKAALLEVAGITGFNLVDCSGDTVKLEEKVVAAVLDALPTSLSFTGFGALTKYDVFLNHRGPDLKKTFVSHLSKALHHASCEPFVAAKALVKGRHAFNSINKALSGVLVHVAIFSPRYAESKYCLNELCDMLASQKPIIPVFYDVEPENLRWTDVGPFAEAFHGHLRKGRDADVVRWKAALLQVAGITGFKLVDCSGDTVKLEEKVVAAVLDALPTPLSLAPARHPVSLKESSVNLINMLHQM